MAAPAFMKTALRGVVAFFGDAWTYRALTSAYDAETRTYGSYTAFTAQVVAVNVSDDYDQLKAAFVKKERIVLKCSDAILLNVGDQTKNATGTVYHVDGPDDAMVADGLIRYRCSRMAPQLGEAQRGGGV